MIPCIACFLPTLEQLPGLIWACFMGMAIGNYATNPIYRLPRNESLFGRTPYCGDCNTELKPRDLFPIFSWLSTRGKCRYCGASVPGAYTVTEFAVTLVFAILYLKTGFSELFILGGLGATALIMLVSMEVIDRFFSRITLAAFMVFGALARTLQDHTILNFLEGAFYAGLLGLLIWKLFDRKIKLPPPYVLLFCAAGVWLPLYAFLFFLVVLSVLLLMAHAFKNQAPFSVFYTVALLWPVLFPAIPELAYSHVISSL